LPTIQQFFVVFAGK